jgi:hypothetical protein
MKPNLVPLFDLGPIRELVVHVTNEDAARSGVIGAFDERVPRPFDRSVGAPSHFVEFRVADRVVVGHAVNVVALQRKRNNSGLGRARLQPLRAPSNRCIR